MAYTLHIKVVGARNLKAGDSNGFSDPYAKIKVKGKKKAKTKKIMKTLNPMWREEFHINGMPEKGSFTIEVVDWDMIGYNDFLGAVEVPFTSAQYKSATEKWLPLADYNVGGTQGEVNIIIQVLPTGEQPHLENPSVSFYQTLNKCNSKHPLGTASPPASEGGKLCVENSAKEGSSPHVESSVKDSVEEDSVKKRSHPPVAKDGVKQRTHVEEVKGVPKQETVSCKERDAGFDAFKDAVAILVVLLLKDESLPENEKEFTIVTLQSKITESEFLVAELPSGVLECGQFAGIAANQLRTEAGIDIKQEDLIDLTKLAYKGKGEEKGIFYSVGGCSEFTRLFLYRCIVTPKQLTSYQNKLTGVTASNALICLKVIPLEELWHEVYDAKALSSLHLYNKLTAEGKIKKHFS